ncbi:MAG: AAA family ATPase [Fuscovulum sp.]|nr:MAG: AAA family ATPase [Fuscovulum sp.]
MLTPKSPSAAALAAIYADVAIKRLTAAHPKPLQNAVVLRDYLIRQGSEFCCAVIVALNDGTDSVELEKARRVYLSPPLGKNEATVADAAHDAEADDLDDNATDSGTGLPWLSALDATETPEQPPEPNPPAFDLDKVILTLTELHGAPVDRARAEANLKRMPAWHVETRMAEIDARRLDPTVAAVWFDAPPYECELPDLSEVGITEKLPLVAYEAYRKLKRELNSKRERIVFPATVSAFNIDSSKKDHEVPLKEASKPRLALRLSRDEIDVAFAAAYEDAPWLGRPLAYLHRAAVERTGQDFSLPPVLIYGPAGYGKTTLASSLGRHLGIDSRRIEMAGATAVFDISGSERTWSTASSGVPVTLATSGTYATSLCVFDEVEKAGGRGGGRTGGNPLDALLGILSEVSRKSYRCPFLKTEVDLTHVSFILTANSINGVSAPLKDRCAIFEVGMPSFDQALDLIEKADPEGLILNEVRTKLAELVSNGALSLRKMHRAIEDMLIRARRRPFN